MLSQCFHPRTRAARSSDSACQNGLERHHPSVEGARVVLVLVDGCAIQRDSCEHTARARIRKHFGSHLPIRRRVSMTSDWSSGNAGIGTKLELAAKQVL